MGKTGAATTVAKPMSGNLVPITGDMLQKAASDPKNWIHSNGNYDNTRYYPGAQINAGNVAKLAPARSLSAAMTSSSETEHGTP